MTVILKYLKIALIDSSSLSFLQLLLHAIDTFNANVVLVLGQVNPFSPRLRVLFLSCSSLREFCYFLLICQETSFSVLYAFWVKIVSKSVSV